MKEEEEIKRIEAQVRKSKLINYDPTTTLLNTCQKYVS